MVTKWQNTVEHLSSYYDSLGFMTLSYFHHNSKKDFIDAWKTEGIAGVFFAGHGGDGGLVMDAISNDFAFPNDVHPPYKLSAGHFYACDSKQMSFGERWQDHFAVDFGADFLGFSDKAYLWTKEEGPVVQPSLWEADHEL